MQAMGDPDSLSCAFLKTHFGAPVQIEVLVVMAAYGARYALRSVFSSMPMHGVACKQRHVHAQGYTA